MELFSESAWYIQLLFNVLMLALPTLAGLAIAGELGAQTIKRTKKVYAEWVRPAIDEADDPAIKFLAGKSGRDPKWVSDQLIAVGDQVVALLPEEAPLTNR